MGLLGSIIGGAFDLAGAAAGAAINAGVSAHNEKKLRQEIDSKSAMLDEFMRQCVSSGKKNIEETKLLLYKNGLSESIDELLRTLVSLDRFLYVYVNILSNEKDVSEVYNYVKQCYEAFFVLNEKYAITKEYKRAYISAKNDLVRKIKDKLNELLSSETGVFNDCNKAINYFFVLPLLCLLEIVLDDSGYNKAICSLHNYHMNNRNIFCYITSSNYGEFDLNNVEDADIEMLRTFIRNTKKNIMVNESGYYEGIAYALKPAFINKLAQIMWYYAKKVPFDQRAFDNAVSDLNKYTSLLSSDNELECIIAEIYVKNQLGGENLVFQNLDVLMEQASFKNPVYARAICSFLAWIECYNIELEVLKKAVQEKIQLNSEMLDRLEFLSKGGTDNKYKIYDAVSTEKFIFDSSTLGIDSNGIDSFFDLMQRKNKTLQYSLLLEQWSKTIPLPKGKAFSNDLLIAEFKSLVDDFDGEIKYSVSDAAAVDTSTISYNSSSLFRFMSERNRGIIMLFNCEKFGRNLNIVILTLFSPVDLNVNDMAVYAKSALNNRYVESFRESILQAVDSSLKDKVDIYNNESASLQNSMFE